LGVIGLRHKIKKSNSSEERTAFLMLLPFFLLFTLFILIPIFYNLVLSFTNFNLRTMDFVGLRNYINLFKDNLFLMALKNTLIYTFFTVILVTIISFFLSVMLNKNSYIVKIARSAVYVPHVTSMVAVSMIWLWLYEPLGGVFNQVLSLFGISAQKFLLNSSTALMCIIVMSVWKSVGYNMVLFLAGLQGVPQSLYEAAEIDGAGAWQKIKGITLPMLQPVIFFVLTTNIINSFNVFESVSIMTNGGPLNSTTTLVHQIYTRSFGEYQAGYGAAIAIVLCILMLTFITICMKKFMYQETDLS